MDPNTSPPCPTTATVRRNPHRRARATPKTTPQSFDLREIPPFPHDDVLSAQTPESKSTSLPKLDNQNLKVFLRIRPLPSSPIQAPRVRTKSAWPQNPIKKNTAAGTKISKKKSSGTCILVNDSQSVTLSTALSLQESKRIKSETYGGFSHVFSSDSSQFQVYERMVKPMVEEFLKGRSGMFAALGPSGSGKTHTVFGCARDPGMVPLILRHIFKETEPDAKQESRSFYMSIFEIYSERSKAEKVFDLLPDGGELSMQQSTVKGLKEVLISNVEQTESLIAQAVLKRATAMTNTNSQSSRSQCIINICDVPQKCKGVVNPKSNGAVLTIVDFAGAEREKRTGNQGTRLLESNFINNTLMVFGLCLRSLLEHQKNPKKPLQKHFQNSMLTRYLRDYLEGKKRMTLILTAKSGEEDYLDTSYLLRQASPYMQIKYNEVETSNMVPRKRHYQTLSIMDNAKLSPLSEHLKKMRLVSEHTEQNDEKNVEERNSFKEDASTICKLGANSSVSFKSECDSQLQTERSHIIMQNFAKVIWNVLKQYNSKLKVAEMEIESRKESIGFEKKKFLELERQFNEFKACCTCCKGGKVKTEPVYCSSVDVDQPNNWKQEEKFHAHSSSELRVNQSDEEEPMLATKLDSENLDREVLASSKPEHHNDLEVDAGSKIPSESFHTQKLLEPRPDQSDEQPTLGTSSTQLDSEKSDSEVSTSLSKHEDHNTLEVGSVSMIPSGTFQSSSEPRLDQSDEEPMLSPSCTELDSEKPERKILASSSKQTHHNPLEVEAESEMPINSFVSSSLTKDDILHPLSLKDVLSTETHNLVSDSRDEIGINDSRKPAKPKRTLMPSSSMLSRDLSAFDLCNESEKIKGNRSTRKLAAHDPIRSKGRISLLHMLQGRKSNLHL
ncbi:kinesin-like protein KIN-6 [Abrus precatorius]|uniref:Kinesin-like protein KIN-6 n=1 Tax=Abrus precatorius TaxID=3816 RepID=A0A8B8LE21_ABRPR|nr:kinesin-like protein KIN-6 [Abrus precatorius]